MTDPRPTIDAPMTTPTWLEDQMCAFTSDFDRARAGYSPDHLDALVWGLTELLVEPMPNYGIFEYTRQRAEAIRAQNPSPPPPQYAIGSREMATPARAGRGRPIMTSSGKLAPQDVLHRSLPGATFISSAGGSTPSALLSLAAMCKFMEREPQDRLRRETR